MIRFKSKPKENKAAANAPKKEAVVESHAEGSAAKANVAGNPETPAKAEPKKE